MATVNIPYSDVTVKNGIVQEIEFWTNLGDTGVSGDATLLKIMTARVNAAFDRLMPRLLSYTDNLRWDDLNNADLPIGTFNLVSGQSDYTISTDANGLNILNIVGVSILPNATSTYYMQLNKMTLDDPYAEYALSPNPTDIGTPYSYVEKGNTIFLFPQPNYNATAGVKIFFERDPSYFVSTDTTKTAGIPRPFVSLLPLYASYDWLLVNKPANSTLITRLEAQITKRENQLDDMISARNPTHNTIQTSRISFR